MIVLVMTALGSDPVPRASAEADDPPNIVVILTDDQTLSQMVALPRTQALLGGTGMTFTNAVVSYPLCCPSRATLLTGQYTQNNGVRSNNAFGDGNPIPEAWSAFRARAEARSVAVALKGAGYHTGLLGKYLNGYDGVTIPPGWEDWRGLHGDGLSYWNTTLNVNGHLEDHPGEYQSDLLADEAVDMLDAVVDEPFFFLFNFSAPHVQTDSRPAYADRFAGQYQGARAPRTPAFDEADLSDKPPFLRSLLSRLRAADIRAIDNRWRSELRTLSAVDEAVERIVAHLRDIGALDDTVIVFTSDNGTYHGEHRIRGAKYLPYEPAVRVPLIVSGPAVADGLQGTSVDQPVANIDLAPTLLDLAGVEPLAPTDGRSLAPLLDGTGEATWSAPGGPWNPSLSRERPILLIGVRTARQGQSSVTYSGVRTGDGWVYLKWQDPAHTTELYDLNNDPDETRSLARAPAYRGMVTRLERQRRLLVRCAHLSCEVPPYGYLDLPAQGPLPAWFASAQWGEEAGLGVGFEDGTFQADLAATKGQVMSWLWHRAGAPSGQPPHGFTDVPSYLEDAVRWAVAEQVLTATSGAFEPELRLTREVLADWLWRAAGQPTGNFAPAPPDVAPSAPRLVAVRWLLTDPDGAGPRRAPASLGADGRFRPTQPVTRAEAIVWLHHASA